MPMLLIGENLNVINREIGRAFKEMDPGPIAAEAKRQAAKKMDWIDINLGPARKGGPELMEFVVKTVQEEIGDPDKTEEFIMTRTIPGLKEDGALREEFKDPAEDPNRQAASNYHFE